MLASDALEKEREAHAARDAERGEAARGLAAAHLVEQRDDDPRPCRADGMAERDRAAVHVEPRSVEAQGPIAGEDLGGERASFSSRRDRSRRAGFPRSSSFRTAGTGPIPMIAGSTPAVA